MAHIGDVHADLIEPVVKLLDREGVVEVLGILRVDGAGPRIAEVLTLSHILVSDLARNLIGSILHFLRILVRQAVLCENSVHLHIVVARLSKYIHYLADNILVLTVRPCRDLHHGLVVGLSAFELVLRNENILCKGVLRRDEERDILVDTQTAHKLVFGTLQDLDDLRLLDMLGAARHHRHAHAVTREGRHRVALRDEDGLVAAVGDKRVLTVRLADEAALLHLTFGVELKRGVAHLRDGIVPRHLFERIHGEHLQRMGVEMERAEDIFKRQSLVGLRSEEVRQRLGKLFLRHTLTATTLLLGLVRRMIILVVFLVFLSHSSNGFNCFY
jgi:hypothetical protein